MKRFTTLVMLAISGLFFMGCRESQNAAPKNVFLITLDTLRADHLSLYGYPRSTDPFLEDLGRRSLVFDNVYASMSTTAPSHATMFTGLHPAQHRVLRNGEHLNDMLVTLASIYRKQGFRTAGFVGVGFLREMAAGFEEFSAEKGYRPASEVLARAMDWIRTQSKDDSLFVWVHIYDIHQRHVEHLNPSVLKTVTGDDFSGDAMREYLAEAREVRFESNKEAAHVVKAIDRYDSQILSVDQQLASFYTTLTLEHRNDDALWVIVSDHGEGLGSHGVMGHGRTMFNEQLRVPLIFHFTDRRAEPRRIKGLSRLVDLGPTLAELVGDSFDAQMIPIEGRSFLPVVKGDRNSYAVDSSFAQRRPTDRKQLREGWRKGDVYSLLTSRYKLIIHTGSGNELYDLESDPLEQVNIIEDAPVEVVEHLVEQLSEQYRRMTGQGERLQLGPIDPEHIEELKALGYL
jgi:arylsulfatase A-like enzyme